MTPASKRPADEDLAELGNLVRHHRKEAGLTQEGVADLAGLHWSYVSDVERGRRNPTFRVLVQLSRALGVKPGDLFPD